MSLGYKAPIFTGKGAGDRTHSGLVNDDDDDNFITLTRIARVHTVMEKSCIVIEFEICIPGLEKSCKLDKFV